MTEKNKLSLVAAPVILAVFAIYLTIGMTLGILPGFVEHELHAGGTMVGIVIGLQSLSTLLTRAYSGKVTDTKGARRSCYKGVLLTMLAGAVYLIASIFNSKAIIALGLVLLSRIIHGMSESLLVTGALTWGIGLAGSERSGKIMTWNGIAMYAGIALGAPLGILLKGTFGIESAFITVLLLPVVSWLVTLRLPALAVDTSRIRAPFYKVIGKIAEQGLGLAFSSIGFACISAFIGLFFTWKNWGDSSVAFMVFGSSYVLIRVFFSSFPDRFGGYKVTAVSLIVQIIGQLFIAFAASKTMAIIGCGLTGAGFSLIFPSLGVMAIKKVDPQMRGTALGAYTAFFDLSLGIAGPMAGIIASYYNYQTVYLFGAASCLVAFILLSLKLKKA